MRKPRDIDAELKALTDKATALKTRKIQQLGELVIATGADAKDAETLAGALLVIAETSDSTRTESWRKRGAAFFQGGTAKGASGTERQQGGVSAAEGSTPPV